MAVWHQTVPVTATKRHWLALEIHILVCGPGKQYLAVEDWHWCHRSEEEMDEPLSA